MSPRAYFARHTQTMVGSLGRIAATPLAALMTMAVIGVALSLPVLFNLFLQNVRAATVKLNDAYDLSVYMDKQAPSARAQSLAKQLRQRADVAAVRIITADEALAAFRGDSGFGKALDALEENPLPDTLIVTPSLKASTPEGTEALKNSIAGLAEVKTVQLDTEWVKRLRAMLDVARSVVLITAGLLGVGIVLGVSNTIRLDILNRRTEIEVMKLVGATDGFARRPFLYSGIWYGFGGGLVALCLVAVAAAWVALPVRQLALLYGSDFELHGLSGAAGIAVLGGSIGLAWLGSWVAASRHIRAIDPS